MQQREQGRQTRARERLGRGRFGVPRALTAFLLFLAMLGGTLGAGPGAQCARRNVEAARTGHQQAISATDFHRAAPDQQAPSEGGGLPASSQGCTSAIALPVFAMMPAAAVQAQATPLERLAALVATHEPPTLFRPPRVI
jgi:hypothetical protein